MTATALQHDFFEPGEYLNQRAAGWFTLAAQPAGNWTERNYETKHLATVIEGANPRVDTYISQAVFDQRRRKQSFVHSVGLLFADLDTRNVANLRNRKPDELAGILVHFCNCEGIPEPSVIVFSGRGLHAKWLLDTAITKPDLITWTEVERQLVAALADFGGDIAATDSTRVLRLDRTVNTRTGEVCRVIRTAGNPPAHYAFDEFLQRFPIPTRPERIARPGRIIDASDRFWSRRLNWQRFADFQKIARLRGGFPEGQRESALFYALCFRFNADRSGEHLSNFWNEAQSIAVEIVGGTDFYQSSQITSVYRRAIETARGEVRTYNGREYPAIYTPRNQTIIDRFAITSDEQRQLVTIIDRDEKYRRNNERRERERRAAGMKPQPYRHDRPWEALGISRRWFYELRRRGTLPEPQRTPKSEELEQKCEVYPEE